MCFFHYLTSCRAFEIFSTFANMAIYKGNQEDKFIVKREVWADCVKALAIFLMVLCHFNLSSEISKQFIYMFHMPVFFLISGYFDKGLHLNMGGGKKVCQNSCCSIFVFLSIGTFVLLDIALYTS